MPDPVDLREKLARVTEAWTPRIVAACNGQHVKVARLRGEFDWHAHADSDELFLVVDGRLRLRERGAAPGDEAPSGERETVLEPGQLHVVPRGVEHLPIADPECTVMMVEAAGTRNTGEVRNERTVDDPEWI